MAQVDTNIILGGPNGQLDVSQGLRALALSQQIGDASQRNRLTDLALAEKQGLNNAYAAALNPDGTVDQTRLTQGLAASGQGSAIPGAQRALTDANTSQLSLRTAEREKLNRDVQLVASGLNGVTDEASYQAAKTRLSGLGVPIDGAPERFDPTWVRNTQSQALTAQQFLSQQQQQQQQAQSQSNYERDFAQRQGKIDYDQANPILNVVETSQGTVGVNPRTLSANPVTLNGQALPGKTVNLNEGQSKDLLFSNRMQEANNILTDLESKDVFMPSVVKSAAEEVPLIGGVLGAAANAFIASPEQQKVDQAQRDFINAVLRKESGAAISAPEFDNARKQYFPQLGDSKAVIEQKAANRREAISGVRASIPAAYDRQQGNQRSEKPAANSPKTIRRRGKLPDGRAVVEYSDGTREVQ